MKKYIYKLLVMLEIIVLALNLINNYSFALENNLVYVNDVNKYVNQDEVTLEICANNLDKNIVVLGIHVKYDKSKLEFVRAEKGDDLNASLFLAENFEDESKVGIGMMSSSGFKNNGIYYKVTFKVLDSSTDIPVTLALKEASDSKGNSIEVNLQSGNIKIVNEENEIQVEKSPDNQNIKSFESSNLDLQDNLDKLIQENGNIKVSGDDYLVYETENTSIVEILDDGTIIPNQDGTTNVRVKLNDNTIGNVEITVKNGEVANIKASDQKLEFDAKASTSNGTVIKPKEFTENNEETNDSSLNVNEISNESTNTNESILNSENNSNLKIILGVIVIIIILFLIFKIFIKKNKKKYSKK